jgi:hypothetical protein
MGTGSNSISCSTDGPGSRTSVRCLPELIPSRLALTAFSHHIPYAVAPSAPSRMLPSISRVVHRQRHEVPTKIIKRRVRERPDHPPRMIPPKTLQDRRRQTTLRNIDRSHTFSTPSTKLIVKWIIFQQPDRASEAIRSAATPPDFNYFRSVRIDSSLWRVCLQLSRKDLIKVCTL